MRCPKCGAFLDPGKDVCFMCGVNVKTYVPDNNSFAAQNQGYNSNDSQFKSGKDFSSPNPNMNQYNTSGSSSDSWRGVKTPKDEKDIFDFYAEHKLVIRIVLLIVLVLILIFAGIKYYQYKTKPVELVPVIQDLYFEVDDGFENISAGARGGLTYSLSGEKGSDCSISITSGSTTSENYVQEFFEASKTSIEPEVDKDGEVIDPLKIYSAQENTVTLNGTKWYYMNIFYRKDLESDFNILKYKYMTVVNKGYYYSILLSNNSNSASCNSGLDNFVKSLEFIEK